MDIANRYHTDEIHEDKGQRYNLMTPKSSINLSTLYQSELNLNIMETIIQPQHDTPDGSGEMVDSGTISPRLAKWCDDTEEEVASGRMDQIANRIQECHEKALTTVGLFFRQFALDDGLWDVIEEGLQSVVQEGPTYRGERWSDSTLEDLIVLYITTMNEMLKCVPICLTNRHLELVMATVVGSHITHRWTNLRSQLDRSLFFETLFSFGCIVLMNHAHHMIEIDAMTDVLFDIVSSNRLSSGSAKRLTQFRNEVKQSTPRGSSTAAHQLDRTPAMLTTFSRILSSWRLRSPPFSVLDRYERGGRSLMSHRSPTTTYHVDDRDLNWAGSVVQAILQSDLILSSDARALSKEELRRLIITADCGESTSYPTGSDRVGATLSAQLDILSLLRPPHLQHLTPQSRGGHHDELPTRPSPPLVPPLNLYSVLSPRVRRGAASARMPTDTISVYSTSMTSVSEETLSGRMIVTSRHQQGAGTPEERDEAPLKAPLDGMAKHTHRCATPVALPPRKSSASSDAASGVPRLRLDMNGQSGQHAQGDIDPYSLSSLPVPIGTIVSHRAPRGGVTGCKQDHSRWTRHVLPPRDPLLLSHADSAIASDRSNVSLEPQGQISKRGITQLTALQRIHSLEAEVALLKLTNQRVMDFVTSQEFKLAQLTSLVKKRSATSP
eukprot:GHVH01010837.1.p1 GENE.GHVH01010837.1~~GHVH01010837.1.p1  ORF type:complete len:666 (+),score=76.17 GHVH01010837.1:127-2124(+)